MLIARAGVGNGSLPGHLYPPGHSHEHTQTHSHGSHPHSVTSPENVRHRRRRMEFDMEKVRSTLKQLVRDWSEEVSSDVLLAGQDISLKHTTFLET
jgi:N2227-like protein